MTDSTNVMRFINHIEKRLGEPSESWKESGSQVYVNKYSEQPQGDLVTFLTIGLSGHDLKQESGSKIRQELMITVSNNFEKLPIEDLLFVVAKDVLSAHQPLQRGQVITRSGTLLDGITCSALFCTVPGYFEPSFTTLPGLDGIETVLVDLVPITTDEESLIEADGATNFENLLDDGRIPIFDLAR